MLRIKAIESKRERASEKIINEVKEKQSEFPIIVCMHCNWSWPEEEEIPCCPECGNYKDYIKI